MTGFYSGETCILSDSSSTSMLEAGALMGLLPVALAQNLWLRVAGRRLPEPLGAHAGWTGEASAEPLRLLVAGDSLALGVGCSAVERSLAPRLAYNLALRLRRRVEWQVIGGRHWTAAELLRALSLQGAPAHDIGILLLGVNDTLGLTAIGRWRREFSRILDHLEAAGGRLLISSGVRVARPLPVLPWPLNALLSERGRRLDQVAFDVIRSRRPAVDQACLHLPIAATDLLPHLQRDGFHPSATGYARWASWLAQRTLDEWQALPEALTGINQAS
ncbi:MAG: SGNH/GDSL hydrolase family protein [Gammaproteobacteria bacterium]|nr:SGNH/GDSL hydrolase family protein [Gammaproteobacteria bacterium]